MVRQHHQLNGHDYEQTPGNSGGQRSLMCGSSQGHKELDITQQPNNKCMYISFQTYHKKILSDLKGQKFVLSVVEARNLKSSCCKGHASSKVSKKESFLASSQLQVVGDNLWYSLNFRCITPISGLYIEPTLIQHGLRVTLLHLKYLIVKQGYIHMY